jgi:uncharacterized Zn-binding protein involved in type VI secretion
MLFVGRRATALAITSAVRCSGQPVIVEGRPFVTMTGIPIAVEGMKTSCGAILIGSATAQTMLA